MRDRVLLGGRVLTEGAPTRALTRGLEDRVVAEASGPGRTRRDPAPGRPASGDDLEASSARRGWSGHGEREDTDVPRAPSRERHAIEGGEELQVVLGIRGGLAGESPGADAGLAAEGLDLEARVVGEGREPGGPGREPGLDPGVGLERQAVLDRVALDAELLERDEVQIVDALEGQQLAELAQLVGRPRRDDEPAPGPSECAQRRTVASAAA